MNYNSIIFSGAIKIGVRVMVAQWSFKLYFTACLIFLFSSASHAITLQSGEAQQFSLNSMVINKVDITVPANASSLTVTVSDGTGDLDLYLKFGQPVSGSTVSEIEADADIKSIGSAADESIVLNSSTTPVLKEGIWYISVLNWNASNTTFKITATIEQKITQPVASTGTGGLAAAAIIVDGSDVSVIGMNFSDQFEMESILELQNLLLPLLADLGGNQEALHTFPSDVLLDIGYDGEQFHELAVSVLDTLKMYIQVNVTKINNASGDKIRLDIYQWDNEYPSGQFLGGLEVADPLPLMPLLSLISDGTRFIKISSLESINVNGDEFIRMEFYFQETATSESIFLATVEVTGLLISKVFSLLQSSE